MHAYLTGAIKEIRPGYVVLEVNNVGYLITVPNPYIYKLDLIEKVYVHTYIRDTDVFLYGFNSIERKEFFLKLIGVSGIGPRSALSILACENLDEVLTSIETGNIKFLTKFPGIGMKSAQQIILDLKGKLVIEETVNNLEIEEVSDALHALGYSKSEIKKVLKKITISNNTASMVKEALSMLIK